MPLVTAGQVATDLGRTLTAEETQRVEALIEECTAALELHLNRKLEPTTLTDVVHPPVNGMTQLRYGPVTAVESVSRAGSDGLVELDPAGWYFRNGFLYLPLATREVTVTYMAGEEPSPAARMVVRRAVVATVAGAAAAAKGIGSYSVEGTSITFTGPDVASDPQSVGAFTVGELGAVARLRRLEFA